MKLPSGRTGFTCVARESARHAKDHVRTLVSGHYCRRSNCNHASRYARVVVSNHENNVTIQAVWLSPKKADTVF